MHRDSISLVQGVAWASGLFKVALILTGKQSLWTIALVYVEYLKQWLAQYKQDLSICCYYTFNVLNNQSLK